MKYQTIAEVKQDHPYILNARAKRFLGFSGKAYLKGHCVIIHNNPVEEEPHYAVYALTKNRTIFLDKTLTLQLARAVANAYNVINN